MPPPLQIWSHSLVSFPSHLLRRLALLSEPRAVITAGQELYLDRGSTLRLTCQVLDAPNPSEFLLWYHEQKVANYEVEKVEVSVGADDNGTTTSTLTLEDAQVHNSGLYTCSPSNAKPASIRVHVLSGEWAARANYWHVTCFCGLHGRDG
ncbi:hypothetical protein E2C01_074879 [Portunus trituberculatus]|uniref:Ig-like domain-containing protein n=1 Tax=Portunus trituberculatus TaxID=210409 RepID=A0A5B7I960_PORTR|nr:hypothetical protein [Portunus trituberculatus]